MEKEEMEYRIADVHAACDETNVPRVHPISGEPIAFDQRVRMALGLISRAVEWAPDDYVCAQCGARGIRLYRDTVSRVLCHKCSWNVMHKSPTLAAIPNGKGSFWGATSAPDDAAAWWKGLPTYGASRE